MESVNDARFAIFSKTYNFKSIEDRFTIETKNIDATSFSLCESELRQQIERAAYISSIWRNAHLNSGWEDVDGNYLCRWFEGDQIPNFISDVCIQPEKTSGMNTLLLCYKSKNFFN